jgi:hypothetical protein
VSHQARWHDFSLLGCAAVVEGLGTHDLDGHANSAGGMNRMGCVVRGLRSAGLGCTLCSNGHRTGHSSALRRVLIEGRTADVPLAEALASWGGWCHSTHIG